MVATMQEVMNPGLAKSNAAFPHAPQGWTPAAAQQMAAEEGIDLSPAHFEVLGALQSYFAIHDKPDSRELHDALDERFHMSGGLRYVYTLFPGGPVAQGSRLAGLPTPSGSRDLSFGSVE